MSRRWWDSPEHSVEDERAWFAEAGLDWELDEDLFRNSEVVVFRGALRLGERCAPAAIIYPPAYDAGEQPMVVAPELNLGRHRAPNGALCLDHPVMGGLAPMCGAEAVERAERLWHMWENDRDLLHEEEADAPDPWGNYVDHVPESAILLDVPEQIGERGYLEVGFSSLSPARGSLVGLRQTHPTAKRFELSEAGRALAGEYRVQGVWQRLEEPPPDPRSFAISNWVGSEHRPLIARAQEYANGHPDPEMPTLVGFVYPNEGPGRGEYHDAWLFLLIRPNQPPEYPRPFPIGSNDAWARQPELSSLVGRSVGVVGAGALGSQVAALLARAGVRRFVLVDHDIVTPGNRVRHELDLADAGRSKTTALADRLRRIDPWCEVEERTHRLGHINAPMLGGIQASDDEVAQLLGGVDLIVNTTADSAAGHHCSKLARQEGRTALHAWVGPGAWGGRVLIQREAPERSGCTECLARWQEDPAVGNGATAVEVPELVADPAPQEVIERGCADPSFTGPGFELTAAAAAAARAAAQLLRTEDSSYPVADFDLMTLRFRSSESAQAESHYTRLPTHPRCSICHG